MVLLLLVSLCWAGKAAVEGFLGVLLEISTLMFCSMVLWGWGASAGVFAAGIGGDEGLVS